MSAKTKILEALLENKGNYISGQELAEKLNVTRTAVWKSIDSLKSEGYSISAVKNKGYKLSVNSDLISEESIRCALDEQFKDIPLFVYESIPSTNTKAREMADKGAVHGTLIVADSQTEGRGRRGKSFFSPAGTGLYMSMILKLGSDITQPQLITVAAAVVVSRALEKLNGLKPEIKWVNDIMLDGKKICGILTEAVMDVESGGIDCIVLGVGVNCSTKNEDFPEELQSIAGSADLGNATRSELAAEIYTGIMAELGNLTDPKLMEEYIKRSMMIGKKVSFISGGMEKRAQVTGINRWGNLEVEYSDGTKDTLCGGEVSVVADRR